MVYFYRMDDDVFDTKSSDRYIIQQQNQRALAASRRLSRNHINSRSVYGRVAMAKRPHLSCGLSTLQLSLTTRHAFLA
jgi:hypothetical protein